MGFQNFAYHKTMPTGKIFYDEDEYKAAMESGWVAAPWLVGQEDNNKELARTVPSEATNPTNERLVGTDVAKLCECGCGTPVKNRFVRGHFRPQGAVDGNSKDGEPPDKVGT